MLPNYEEKLNLIQEATSKLVGDIIIANENALDGFVNMKLDRLDNVKLILKNLDQGANDIDNEIITTIALFGPEANNLRELIAFLKVTNEIVRVSDNTKSYAKNMKQHLQSDMDFSPIREYAVPLHKTAVHSLQLSSECFHTDDSDEMQDNYRRVCVEESKTDDLYSILEKNILANACKEQEFSADYIRTLSTMRKLERIADRAVNISKLMLFAKNGGKIALY
jgi:phosphate transport system protein